MANGFASIAQNFRDMAEYFDNLSEDARESAERTKAAALAKLDEPFRQNLINGLGAATTDQERCDAAKAALDAIQAMIDRLIADLAGAAHEGILEFVGPTQATRDLLACLKAFHDDLVKIKTFETLRDGFRATAEVFAGM